MTEIAATADTALVLPHTGELISLDDTNAVAAAIDEIRQHEQSLRDIKAILTDALVQESQRQGSKTLRLQYLTVEVAGGPRTVYDPERLLELRDAGLPEDRFDALVRAEVTYKVSAAEAKRIAGSNPEYARIIEQATSVDDKPFYVKVGGKK